METRACSEDEPRRSQDEATQEEAQPEKAKPEEAQPEKVQSKEAKPEKAQLKEAQPESEKAHPADANELKVVIRQFRHDKPSFEKLPHSFLLKVFQRLTIQDKLKTETVSKYWQKLVKASLRLETSFRIKEIWSLKLRLACHELGENVAKLFKRMCDPTTKTTCLTHVDIGQPFCSGDYHMPRYIDHYFPLLDTLITTVFPPFTFNLKNLRSFTGLRIKSHEFGVILKECRNLKVLAIENLVSDDIVEAMRKSGKDAQKVTEKYFKNARCSLESFQINPVPGDYFIPLLIETFPGLKEFTTANFTQENAKNMHGAMPDYSPLRDLSLKVLDFSRIYFSGFGTMNLLSQLFHPKDKIMLSLGSKGEVSDESKIAASLEKLRVWWDFQKHGNRGFFFHSVTEMAMLCRNLKVYHVVNEEPPTLFMLQGRDDDERCPNMRQLFNPGNFPKLEDLQLPCAHLEGDDLRFNLPTLKRISICGCWTHPPAHVLQFINIAVRTSPLLEQLHVSFFELDNKFFPRLAKSVAKNPRALHMKVTRLCQFKHFRLLNDMTCCDPKRDRSHDKCPDYLRFLEEKAEKAEMRLTFSFDADCRCEENGPCPCGVS